jgi:hypothetical protein
MGRTFRTAVGLEVIDEVLGVVSKRTVEHYATTRLEKKKLVKVLKEDSGGLMDCAQNGLACVGELAKEADNVEGSTGVETRGRLVKEHQKFRLGSQLDTNSQSLSLLGVKTLTDRANNSASDLTNFQKIDDCFAIGHLLLSWNFLGLT